MVDGTPSRQRSRVAAVCHLQPTNHAGLQQRRHLHRRGARHYTNDQLRCDDTRSIDAGAECWYARARRLLGSDLLEQPACTYARWVLPRANPLLHVWWLVSRRPDQWKWWWW